MQKRVIVGVDEVGRGPLAGPVVACAFFSEREITRKIRDSKQLTVKQREEIYKLFKKDSSVKWGIGKVSEKVIDKINILQATKLAMIKAVEDLEKKLENKINFLLIDGNFGIDIDVPQKSIIKGDEKIPLIAAASIVAKVTRDRLMVGYSKKYSQYGFDAHKGYPTLLHRQKIAQYGFCPIHRKTFHCG